MTDEIEKPNTPSLPEDGFDPAVDPEPSPDPFDPARLILKGNPAELFGVKRVLAHVPVRKPNKQEFIRTHPDPDFRLLVAMLELKAEREFYVVLPEVATEVPGETRPVMLTTSINRQGKVFLWPVPLPTTDGRELAWHTTAREAATLAEKRWIRIVADMNAGAYDIFEAQASMPEPVWPDHSFRDLMRVAFGAGHLIDNLDHPVIKLLLGQE